MNPRFIQSCHIPLKYDLKQGTKGSYYQKSGERGILPERISWGMYAKCKDSNRDSQKVNEINATYKKAEAGLYKGLNQGDNIHSSIWKGLPEYPEFYGYGIIDERHDLFDLLIIYSENICTSSIEIHLFRGMGKPEFMENAFSYLRNYKKNEAPFNNRASGIFS
jgi:hypothetical protein